MKLPERWAWLKDLFSPAEWGGSNRPARSLAKVVAGDSTNRPGPKRTALRNIEPYL